MDLSIVILHYGTPKDVEANLEALENAILPAKTEVIIVNNGYRGANKEIALNKSSKFWIRFFEIPNRGYPQGNNFGLKQASGKVLCILNPDITVRKDTFKLLLDYLHKNPKVGVCAPRLIYSSGHVQDNFRVFPRPFDLFVKRTFLRKFFLKRLRRYLMWDKDIKKSEPVDWLTGAFQVFTRKVWDKVKPNDERYFLFMSDVDLCRTAWNKGFEVHFVGDTEATHHENRLSSGGILDLFRKKTVRVHVKDAIAYYLKYLGKALPKKSPSSIIR